MFALESLFDFDDIESPQTVEITADVRIYLFTVNTIL